MKKAVLITIFAVLLTGCGSTGTENTDAETKAVSQITETSAITTSSETEKQTASDTTTVTTTKVLNTTVSEDSAAKKTSSASAKSNGTSNKQTDKTVKTQSQTSRQISSQNQTQNETQSKDTANRSAATTTVQTTPAPKITTTTTTLSTTTVTKTVTEQITEVIPEEPVIEERSAIERWLNIFGDTNDKSYYVSIGQELPNDGSDYSKARSVFDYMQNSFGGERNCVYMSSVTYALCQGIGLECGCVLISDWYNHCANAVNIDGTWYVLDTQASGFLYGDPGYTNILDEYEKTLGITLSEDDHD